MSPKEHLPEHLSEELTDTERSLLSLAPRASRIDRDRLMLRLGEQNVSRSSTPWKWATAASLLLALGLGVRPALETPGIATSNSEPASVAIQVEAEPRQPTRAERMPTADQKENIPRATDRQRSDETDWLLALASGRIDTSRPLTIRPGLATVAARGRDEPAAEESPGTASPPRAPTLRWGDRRQYEAVEFAAPPRT